MIQLDNLNQEQLIYIKQKWSSETKEIELERPHAAERLNARIDRRTSNEEELSAIQTTLTTAETLLQHLNTTNAPQDLIDAQQAAVDKVTADFNTLNRGVGVLTDEEAMLQQVAIDELALREDYRKTKLSEVEALLTS